ncbi:hypothetical protein BpHYR1_042608 [Brachionus plicatilis]|uniref:Uncharacterized protein n=1 Tax=Brachionus plicatilis TaxID=10195 RepID=A0A3M7PXS6_BRAPC|nr:hypothetical protein BpHYR1_042608 [Brachionus plicatilis]
MNQKKSLNFKFSTFCFIQNLRNIKFRLRRIRISSKLTNFQKLQHLIWYFFSGTLRKLRIKTEQEAIMAIIDFQKSLGYEKKV